VSGGRQAKQVFSDRTQRDAVGPPGENPRQVMRASDMGVSDGFDKVPGSRLSIIFAANTRLDIDFCPS